MCIRDRFHASRAISGVAELVVNCRCCFSLWKVNLTLHCIVTVAAYIGCKVPLCILCRSTLSCTTWPTISWSICHLPMVLSCWLMFKLVIVVAAVNQSWLTSSQNKYHATAVVLWAVLWCYLLSALISPHRPSRLILSRTCLAYRLLWVWLRNKRWTVMVINTCIAQTAVTLINSFYCYDMYIVNHCNNCLFSLY